MKRNIKVGLAVGAITFSLVAAGTSGAVAGKLVTSSQIKDGTIRAVDIKPNLVEKFSAPGEQGPQGEAGPAGAQGPAGPTGADGKDGANGPRGNDGRDGLEGAIYRVATYANGGAGDATVACADTDAVSKNYTAIAGGIQGGKAEAGFGHTNEFDVAASFPGRMDWGTGEPKANRLDGWIVLGSGGWTDTLRVWALCVPNDSIPVQETVFDN